jgi:RNA polymerase sigma-70 factor, ECF subfamily
LAHLSSTARREVALLEPLGRLAHVDLVGRELRRMLATRGTIASSANQGANDSQPTDSTSQSLDSLEMGDDRAPEAVEPNPVNWQDLVERIHRGEESGMEELYRLFGRGIRYYLCRQLGHQELDDKVHDTFVIVVQAIRRGELREPDRLMGFVRTVVRRQVAAYIDEAVHSRRDELNLDLGVRVADRRNNPEQSAAFRQKVDLMLDVLNNLSERDREILTRFYLDEQSQETICREMILTETQFRLLKSRAKARFGEIGKRKLSQKPLISVSLRTSVR